MAAVRLRRAFRYPEDSDNEHERDELDEEEQERLIEQLQRQNDARNAQYNVITTELTSFLPDLFNPFGVIFTGIPLISTIALLPSAWRASYLSDRLCSLLGILSLLSTAYIMWTFPLHPDRKGKKPSSAKDERLAFTRTILVPANGLLCGLLAFYFLVGADSSEPWPALYLIPGAVLGTILLAQRVMLSVDLSTLKDLQYEFKGA